MILPLDLEGFVNLIPNGLKYTGPDILMQEKTQYSQIII